MTKHTPGPWIVSGKEWPKCGHVLSKNLNVVAFAASRHIKDDVILEGESWLEMRERTQPQRDALDAEIKANARLIAAAPELLEALQMVMQHGRIDDSESRMNMVAAAIAKATGGTP